VALLTSAAVLASERGSVGLIDDHELWTGALEITSPPLGLDEVRGDDHERMKVKNCLFADALPLEASGGRGQDQRGIDVKLGTQLFLPLPGQMRGAKHGQPLNYPGVNELARYERSLDRLTDSNVVRDQEANGIHLEGHQQRHELVRPGFNGDPGKASERPCPRPETEFDRIS
jgi:hypothetical protein